LYFIVTELSFLNIICHGTIFRRLLSEIFLERFRLSLQELRGYLRGTSGVTAICPEVGTIEIMQDLPSRRGPFS
jgi:hypothetical protein